MLELCFSESAGGCLKSAVNEGILPRARIACLPLALSFGDISAPENIEEKKEFYDTLFEDYRMEYSGVLKNYMAEFQKERENADSVRLWYSDAPSEFCGMLYAADLFCGKGIPVYRINCSRMLLEQEAGIVKGIGHSGEMEPRETAFLANSAERMSGEMLAQCSAEWKRLAAENAPLRVMENGRAVSADAGYYDGLLMKHIPQEGETLVARVIGEMIGEEQIFAEDYFLAKRIRELIASGRLREGNRAKHFYRSTVARV